MDEYHYNPTGILAGIASMFIFYWAYKFHKAKKSKIKLWCLIILGTMCILSGCVGIYKQSLDGINWLVFGITLFIDSKYDRQEHDLFSLSEYISGWGLAIIAIIFGIIRILLDLGIL